MESERHVWVGQMRARREGERTHIVGIGDEDDIDKAVAREVQGDVTIRFMARNHGKRGGYHIATYNATVDEEGPIIDDQHSLGRILVNRVGAGRMVRVEVGDAEAIVKDEGPGASWEVVRRAFEAYVANCPHCKPGQVCAHVFKLNEVLGRKVSKVEFYRLRVVARSYVAKGLLKVQLDGRRRLYVRVEQVAPE